MSSDEEGTYQRQNSLFEVERVSDVDKSDIDHFWDEHQVCVELSRGDNGFGLTLEGGANKPLFEKDNGVFITAIKKGSNAEKLGCLEVGDKILEVDGTSLDQLSHEKAVELFKRSTGKVRLVIHKHIGNILGISQDSRSVGRDGTDSPTSDSRELKGFSPVGFVFGIAIGCVFVFAVRRYLMRR